jgi:hypothetical protein
MTEKRSSAPKGSAVTRKFNPDGPRKKPFYDTKRKKLVVPQPCNGNDASSPASGMEASGIPAAGEKALTIERRWDNLSRVPTDTREQDILGMQLLNEVYFERCSDPGSFAISIGLNPYQFKSMAESNEFFKDCLERANYLIGQQLIRAARSRQEDGRVNMALLMRYDKEYRQMMEEMKAKEGARAAAATVVYVERVPDSPLVPLLKKDIDG